MNCLILILAFLSVVEGTCPVGFTQAGSLCLKMQGTTKAVKCSADALCQANGGQLPIMRSASDNNDLNTFAKGQGLVASDWIWLGIVLNNQNKVNSDWINTDGTTYVDWVSGEPNNASGDEYCAIFIIDAQVADAPCALQAYVFCEPDPALSDTCGISTICSGLGVPNTKQGQSCYAYYTTTHTWDDAMQYCKDNAPAGTTGHLAWFYNECTYYAMWADLMAQGVPTGNNETWVGMRERSDLDSRGNLWWYSDKNKPVRPVGWGPDKLPGIEMNTEDSGDSCMRIYDWSGTDKYGLFDATCSQSKKFLCEYKCPENVVTDYVRPSTCNQHCANMGGSPFGDKCLLLENSGYTSAFKKTWKESQAICSNYASYGPTNLRGRLVNIPDAATWTFVQEIVATGTNIYIGLMDKTGDNALGSHMWTSVTCASSNDVASTYAANMGGISSTANRCVKIASTSSAWVDVACSDDNYYMCELFCDSSAPSPSATSCQAECAKECSHYDSGYCYSYHQISLSYSGALSFCTEHSNTLFSTETSALAFLCKDSMHQAAKTFLSADHAGADNIYIGLKKDSGQDTRADLKWGISDSETRPAEWSVDQNSGSISFGDSGEDCFRMQENGECAASPADQCDAATPTTAPPCPLSAMCTQMGLGANSPPSVVDDSCLAYYNTPTNWSMALKSCKDTAPANTEGRLIVYDSQAKWDYVVSVAGAGDEIWMGLRDVDEGTSVDYKWSAYDSQTTCDTDVVTISGPVYHFVYDDQCVRMEDFDGPGAWKWNDRGCYKTLSYICEFKCSLCHATQYVTVQPAAATTEGYPMSQAEKIASTILQTLGCATLIGILAATIVIYALIREFSVERCLHMSHEIALLCAHVIILTARDVTDHKTICTLASVAIHYFFMVVFSFMFLEAVQTYTIMTNVISAGGFLKRLVYLLIGWMVIPIPIVILNAAIHHDSYTSTWSCWLNFGHNVSMGTFGPIILLSIGTLIITEAAGMGTYNKMPLSDPPQRLASHVNQKGLMFVLPANIASWFVGAYAVYGVKLYLYSTVFILNVVLGVCIFMFHTLGNPKAEAVIMNLVKKCRQKK